MAAPRGPFRRLLCAALALVAAAGVDAAVVEGIRLDDRVAIKGRALVLNGSLMIQSGPGRGTQVSVEIPLTEGRA